jgi:hypothetical protein
VRIEKNPPETIRSLTATLSTPRRDRHQSTCTVDTKKMFNNVLNHRAAMFITCVRGQHEHCRSPVAIACERADLQAISQSDTPITLLLSLGDNVSEHCCTSSVTACLLIFFCNRNFVRQQQLKSCNDFFLLGTS